MGLKNLHYFPDLLVRRPFSRRGGLVSSTGCGCEDVTSPANFECARLMQLWVSNLSAAATSAGFRIPEGLETFDALTARCYLLGGRRLWPS
jgi:hypothetical protein